MKSYLIGMHFLSLINASKDSSIVHEFEFYFVVPLSIYDSSFIQE